MAVTEFQGTIPSIPISLVRVSTNVEQNGYEKEKYLSFLRVNSLLYARRFHNGRLFPRFSPTDGEEWKKNAEATWRHRADRRFLLFARIKDLLLVIR